MAELAAAFVEESPLANSVELGQGMNDCEAKLLCGAYRIGLRAAGRLGNDAIDDSKAQALARPRVTRLSGRRDAGMGGPVETAGREERVLEHIDPVGNS